MEKHYSFISEKVIKNKIIFACFLFLSIQLIYGSESHTRKLETSFKEQEKRFKEAYGFSSPEGIFRKQFEILFGISQERKTRCVGKSKESEFYKVNSGC